MDYFSFAKEFPWTLVSAVFSKTYSFWKDKIGAKKAKQKVSLAFQECLKVNPDIKFIMRTLTQYEGKKYLREDLNELMEIKSKIEKVPSSKGFAFIEMKASKSSAKALKMFSPQKLSTVGVNKIKGKTGGIIRKGGNVIFCAPVKQAKKSGIKPPRRK